MVLRTLILVVAGQLALAGARPGGAGQEWRQFSYPRTGISIGYPPGWHAGLVSEDDQLAVTSAAVPLGRDANFDFARTAEHLPPDGAVVQAFEYPGALSEPAFLRHFPPRPRHLRLEQREFHSYEGFGPSYLLMFREHGRAWQVMVALGNRRDPALRSEVERVLDSFRVGSLAARVRTIALPAVPTDVAAGFGSLWVPTANDRLLRIDPHTGHAVASIRTPATATRVLCAFGSVWLAAADHVYRVDRNEDRLAAVRRLGGTVLDLAAGQGSIWASVARRKTGKVARLDPRSGRARWTLFAPGKPVALALAGDSLWVLSTIGSGQWLERIDPARERPRPTEIFSVDPRSTAGTDLAFGDGAVWVGNRTGPVFRIDPRSGRILGSFGNVSVRVAAGGGDVWAVGRFSRNPRGTLAEIDGKSAESAPIYVVGSRPVGVAYGFGSAWVANAGSRTLSSVRRAAQ